MIVHRTGRAIRAEAEAKRKAKVKGRTVAKLLRGDYARIEEETGVNLLAGTEFGPPLPKPSHYAEADAGAGWQEDRPVPDQRSSSETLSDHIRGVLSDPKRREERERLKRGGSHDAKDVPDDAPGAVSYPRVPWEDR